MKLYVAFMDIEKECDKTDRQGFEIFKECNEWEYDC